MPRYYVVHVNDAPAAHYKRGYFPRKFQIKVNAETVAKEAIRLGASFACVKSPWHEDIEFRPESK